MNKKLTKYAARQKSGTLRLKKETVRDLEPDDKKMWLVRGGGVTTRKNTGGGG